MSQSVQAILARFNFNKRKAIQYCETIARTYPGLTKEYISLAEQIANTDTVVLEKING